jgi:RHS repeat-associated protein
MRLLRLFLLLLPLFLRADVDPFEDENPAFFHHVNVITGDLSLYLEDAQVMGAKSFAVTRTYSSTGALERNEEDSDLYLKKLRGGFLIQGGWSFFPHANLLIRTSHKKKDFKAYVSDKNGNTACFVYSHEPSEHEIVLKPEISSSKSYGKVSGRSDLNHKQLYIHFKKGKAELTLPDGSVLHYKGSAIRDYRMAGPRASSYYRLVSEEWPSKHKLHYSYDGDKRLSKVSLTNPAENKTFASVEFELEKTKTPYKFRALTSDGKVMKYKFLEHKERDYLSELQTSCGPQEKCEYTEGRGGQGARICGLHFDGKLQLRVHYYLPENDREDKKWRNHPEKKSFSADKVKKLEGPIGPNGEMIPIAKFIYEPNHTDVRDCENLLIRYHHHEGSLKRIEYFDENDRLASTMKFIWNEKKMVAKVEQDASKQPLFSKTFQYDSAGNIKKEVLWGNLSGEASGPYSLNPDGSLDHAESYQRKYTYKMPYNLLVKEEEEDGLTYKYQYAPDTDLLTAKFTCDGDHILIREFFFYNEDHLIVAELIDDGSSKDPHNHTNVTERRIKRYERDSATGLPRSIAEYYLDVSSGHEILLKKTKLTYSKQNQIETEAVYDSTGTYRYTILTKYDDRGRVISKSNPIGQENKYKYDPYGNLLMVKEIGNPRKVYKYNAANQPISCEEIDFLGDSKWTHSTYDAKGRLLSETNPQGHTTWQVYDAFGKCLRTEFPAIRDENGSAYHPTVSFSYDERGNLASTTNPKGEVTQTFYTTLRKPYLIIDPNGYETRHVYNKNGTLARTVHPDGTEEHFSYDRFQRKTKKRVISNGVVLSAESWEYNAFHLLSHTDERGLTTHYFYDGGGHLVREQAEERSKQYEYDALGFLERTTQNGVSSVQIHDVAGRVLEEWVEDSHGNIENRMAYEYDENNQKTIIKRETSQGQSKDTVSYDGAGRLTSHKDPHGHEKKFIYNEAYQNELGQKVLQKTIIDPLHLSTLETYDALGHLIRKERKDAEGKTVSIQEWYYDKAGNKARQINTVFVNYDAIKTHEILWVYDVCGRLIQEMEGEGKCTRFEYDSKGRLVKKTNPNNVFLTYEYNGKDQVIELRSSDGTVHYLYEYQGPDLIRVHDLVLGNDLQRRYNIFGEIIEESNPAHLHYVWDYDARGRCISFTLPDGSSVGYEYSAMHLVSVQRKNIQGEKLYEHQYQKFDPNGHVEKENQIFSLGELSTFRDLLERPVQQVSSWHTCSLVYGASSLVDEATNTLFGKKTYTYDALQQLKKEGNKEYHFDSLGNATEYAINDCNQVLATPEFRFTYDANGNPLKREREDSSVTYSYDALGRLISLTKETGEMVRFTYDAFSRLVSKETGQSRKYYLYDQEREIGACREDRHIFELKVLGLGIKEDIGAAVAVELAGSVYAPLHDFNGNIIALLSSTGEMVASYDLDAFGKEIVYGAEDIDNPWRFCSKRYEEGFVFFGLRFYDPSIGRWLTPDPGGFEEGPNLYVYVLNCPLNRLDLFGLNADFNFPGRNIYLEVPISAIPSNTPSFQKVMNFKGMIDGVKIDWILSGGNWSQLRFTPEELKAGKINLLDHMHEILPKDGAMVGIMTFQNGIMTSLSEYKKMAETITEKVPERTLLIGLYNPSYGVTIDGNRLAIELRGEQDTSIVALSRQFYSAVGTSISKVNPNLLWLHMAHSEAGIILERAQEGMTQEQKDILKRQLYTLTYGAVHPISNDVTYRAINTYSKKDKATLRYAKDFIGLTSYDIREVECLSSRSEWSVWWADHAFLGKTYQDALENNIEKIRREHRFYENKVR